MPVDGDISQYDGETEMIEVTLLLTEAEAKVLENAILNYAVRLQHVRQRDASPAYATETKVLEDVTLKYLAQVA